ncbi:MAG: metallophosphoesterase [Calditrichaeota bacterium]|nr:MAG: metallophosphoesterase [Calditrichota bacterium]
MKIAVLSDIHANLEALQAVLDYTHTHQVEKLYCLGDCVGYGPDPDACVTLLREKADAIVMGNHDYAAVGLADIRYFNAYARFAIEWTRAQLSPENLNYLKKLPFTREEGDILLVHASPKNPSHWDYVLTQEEARQQFKSFRQEICFIGHSHMPVIFTPSAYYHTGSIILEQGEQYIVNVGSVGQPRDGDPRACFVIYDSDKHALEYIRVQYDVEKTSQKIKETDLPEYLAERILYGQ